MGKFIAPLASPLSGSLLGRLYTVITIPYTGKPFIYNITQNKCRITNTASLYISFPDLLSSTSVSYHLSWSPDQQQNYWSVLHRKGCFKKTRRSNSGLVPVTQGRVGSVSEHCTKWPVSQFLQTPPSRLLSLISVGFSTPISLGGKKWNLWGGRRKNHHLSLGQMKTAFTAFHTHTHTHIEIVIWLEETIN